MRLLGAALAAAVCVSGGFLSARHLAARLRSLEGWERALMHMRCALETETAALPALLAAGGVIRAENAAGYRPGAGAIRPAGVAAPGSPADRGGNRRAAGMPERALRPHACGPASGAGLCARPMDALLPGCPGTPDPQRAAVSAAGLAGGGGGVYSAVLRRRNHAH